MPMDAISFFDWCPLYDLMLTHPSYQDTGLIIRPNYENWVNEWVYAALSKMKPTGSAYIVIPYRPAELKAYLNASTPASVRLEDILIRLSDVPKVDKKDSSNYIRNNKYAILYYRSSMSPPLNEPLTIKNVIYNIDKDYKDNEDIDEPSIYIMQSSKRAI